MKKHSKMHVVREDLCKAQVLAYNPFVPSMTTYIG
jgi:hypothetical protein